MINVRKPVKQYAQANVRPNVGNELWMMVNNNVWDRVDHKVYTIIGAQLQGQIREILCG